MHRPQRIVIFLRLLVNLYRLLKTLKQRTSLGLERFVEGRKQLSDILRRPVSFDPNELKHVDTAAEALAASLNKFGRVEFPYMESLASRSRQELIDELGDRIFYNPMVKGFEIRERLAAGNVVAKAE